MPNQHKTPGISWHSADPTARPWVEAEAARRNITKRELLDEALAEYRRTRETPETTTETGEPRWKA